MNQLCETFCFVMLLTTARSDEIPGLPRTRNVTNVASQDICKSSLSADNMMGTKTLETVQAYSELKHDPRASLPDSFTICSTIMTTSCPDSPWPAFFTILNNERAQFLAPISIHEVEVSSLKIFYLQVASEETVGKIPPLFPNQWTRGCVAVDTTSGWLRALLFYTLYLRK